MATVRNVNFADFNLNNDKSGSFREVKSVKVLTDHELLLQIAADIKNIKSVLERHEKILQNHTDIFTRNNLH
jgi:hypothetical protein